MKRNESPCAEVVLADGSTVLLRSVRQGDTNTLYQLHQRLSDESYRLRFFGSGRRTGRVYVDHLLREHTDADVVTVHLDIEEMTHSLAAAVARREYAQAPVAGLGGGRR